MRLTRLTLTQFRNFQQEEICPGERFNIIWGDNAQGKTNLLEAIYLLGHLKSFRTKKNSELIIQGKRQAGISAEIEKQGVRHTLAIRVEANERSCRLDGKNPGTTAAFLGYLQAVLFSPEEINLVRSYPAGRRALLDRAIFLTRPDYLPLARDYQRQLKQRNKLLKEGQGPAVLKPWTDGLIKNGARLRRARIDYLQRLAPYLHQTYSSICQGKESLEINYLQTEPHQLEAELEQEFVAVAERESRYQQTLAGPHRDDPQFMLQQLPLRSFGSQGQQRSAILAFKCAQVIDYETETGESPLLLLDDMSSELDAGRRYAFFDFVQQRHGQVFLTTTDVSLLSSALNATAREFHLIAGQVSQQH